MSLKSLFTRLIVVVCVALLPGLAVELYTERQAQDTRAQLIEDEALRLVRLVAAQQQRIVDGAEQVLNALAAAPAVQDHDAEGCHRILANLIATSPRYLYVGVLSVDGRELCSSRDVDPTVDARDRGYFRRALDSGGFAVGEYAVGRVTGKPTIHFAKPFDNQRGERAGVMVISLNLEWLGRQLQQLPLPPGARAGVNDRNGVFLVRYPGGASVAGRPIQPDLLPRLRETRVSVGAATSLEGRALVTAYSPPGVEPLGLGVGVGLDRETSFAAVTQAGRTNLALIFGGALLALALTVMLGTRLVRRPVEALLGAAERWRSGDLGARTGLARDGSEFGRLSAAFEDMATALAARERDLRTALESTTDSVAVFDRDWRYRYMNGALRQWIGRDLVGQVMWEAIPQSRGSTLQAALLEAQETGRPTITETVSVLNGRLLQIRAFPSDDGVTLFARDLTVERRAAVALRESEALFRAAFEQAAVGMALLDAAFTILRLNSRLASIAGRSAEALRATSLHAFVGPEATLAAKGGDTLGGAAHAHASEHRYRRPDGAVAWIRVNLSPITGLESGPERFVLFVEDITGRKQAEAALRELTANLENRVRDEVAAREQAQLRAAHAERMQALGQLAGGIAHDFNNVMQAVIGVLTLIERRPDDRATTQRLARLALEATARGASVTRRLLAFARRDELRAEPLDVAELLTSLHEILSHTLGAGIEVALRLAPGLPPVFADRGQLETVLVNLATNARDAMPQGGRLTLAAEPETREEGLPAPAPAARLPPGRYVRIAVTDTGAGMDAETVARACEPFFTTKGIGAGTGLGLSMAKGFAEQSGGDLAIESSPGQGATVTLWLPSVEAGAYRAALPPPALIAPQPSGGGWRVLVVDDDAAQRDVLATHLGDAGFAPIQAASGAEAVAILDSGAPVDAVVTDLSMPGIGGLAVLRAAHRRDPRLPAVLLTGYATDDAEFALSHAIAGRFSLLRKPASDTMLIDRLRALLAARRAPAEDVTG